MFADAGERERERETAIQKKRLKKEIVESKREWGWEEEEGGGKREPDELYAVEPLI